MGDSLRFGQTLPIFTQSLGPLAEDLGPLVDEGEGVFPPASEDLDQGGAEEGGEQPGEEHEPRLVLGQRPDQGPVGGRHQQPAVAADHRHVVDGGARDRQRPGGQDDLIGISPIPGVEGGLDLAEGLRGRQLAALAGGAQHGLDIDHGSVGGGGRQVRGRVAGIDVAVDQIADQHALGGAGGGLGLEIELGQSGAAGADRQRHAGHGLPGARGDGLLGRRAGIGPA